MPSAKDSLKERLARYRQIELSVIGRKSGNTVFTRARMTCSPDCFCRVYPYPTNKP
jgi:hypothetical protein